MEKIELTVEDFGVLIAVAAARTCDEYEDIGDDVVMGIAADVYTKIKAHLSGTEEFTKAEMDVCRKAEKIQREQEGKQMTKKAETIEEYMICKWISENFNEGCVYIAEMNGNKAVIKDQTGSQTIVIYDQNTGKVLPL